MGGTYPSGANTSVVRTGVLCSRRRWQLGLGTLAGLVAQDWEVMHSTKKAEAFTALTDSTMHDDDDGSQEIRAAVPARDEAKETMAPIGSVPRPLRNDARPARGWDLVSLCERDIFPLPCCPTPPGVKDVDRVKGCRRTQQTNGHQRMMQ